MNSLRVAHAAGSPWGQAAKACIEQLGPPGGANLGFVYVTDALAADLDAILAFLRGATGVADWVGTVGLGISATGQEYFDRPAMALLVGDWGRDDFRLFGPALAGLADFRADNRDWLASARPGFGIVHADPRDTQAPALVAELAAETGAFLVGGLTSSRAGHGQIAGRLMDGGASGVLFSEGVGVATGLSQGCTPIGPTHRVTSSRGELLFELDGRPALEVFKDDIGEILARDLGRVAGYIHAALPVSGSDTGDYLVRNLIGIDAERGWLAIAAAVGHGDGLMFVRRDGASARTDLSRMLRDVRRRGGSAPRGGVYFSCLARGPNLFGPDSAELRLLQQELGDIPLVGFFCNGEISHDRLYTYTGVLGLFL